MGLNKSTGNMYDWVRFTWNTIKGECWHSCEYCYCKAIAKRFNTVQKPARFDEKELNTDLGMGKAIFIGSSNDMFNEKIPREWIVKTLEHCNKYPFNQYVFQTKNPKRLYAEFLEYLPVNSIVGTTIESDIFIKEISCNSPLPKERAMYLREIGKADNIKETFVTIEPIMDFNFAEMIGLIYHSGCSVVNVGADSCNSKLPEPISSKIEHLISEMEKITNVKRKDNLKRLTNLKH